MKDKIAPEDTISAMIYSSHNEQIEQLKLDIAHALERERKGIQKLNIEVLDLRAQLAKQEYASEQRERLLRDKTDMAKIGFKRVLDYTRENKRNNQILSGLHDLITQYAREIEK